MTTMVSLLTSALAGAALGGVFFGLLWATVRRLPDSRSPVLLLGLSYLLRLAIAVGGLWLIMAGDGWRLVAAIVGLVAMRSYLLRRIAPAEETGDIAVSAGGD